MTSKLCKFKVGRHIYKVVCEMEVIDGKDYISAHTIKTKVNPIIQRELSKLDRSLTKQEIQFLQDIK